MSGRFRHIADMDMHRHHVYFSHEKIKETRKISGTHKYKSGDTVILFFLSALTNISLHNTHQHLVVISELQGFNKVYTGFKTESPVALYKCGTVFKAASPTIG